MDRQNESQHRIKARFWSDHSPEAMSIARQLEIKGYDVDHILSGDPRPMFMAGAIILSGYVDIRCTLRPWPEDSYCAHR